MANNNRTVIKDVSVDSPKKKSRNILAKILCILGALVLWIYVMMVESPQYETTLEGFTVQLENEAVLTNTSGLSIYDVLNGTVNLTISGKKSTINKLKMEDITVTADVGGVNGVGRNSLDLVVNLPDGVSLVKTSPSSVIVYAENTATASVPVTVKKDNLNLSSPYELGTVTPDYDSITITGAGEKVKSVASAQVTVDMSGKTSSFVQSCTVKLLDSDKKPVDQTYLKLSVNEMNVKVQINKTAEIPIECELKYGLIDDSLISITTTPQSLKLRGEESAVESALSKITPIVIDEKTIEQNKYSYTVKPDFLQDGICDTEEITVNVELSSELTTKTVSVKNVNVENAKKGLKYSIDNSGVNVKLRGLSEELKKIKAEDIKLSVDLGEYDEKTTGVISCPVTVTVNSEYSSVYELNDYSVQVKFN